MVYFVFGERIKIEIKKMHTETDNIFVSVKRLFI